jgi:hypothetical protein
MVLTRTNTHTLSALPLGPFHLALGGGSDRSGRLPQGTLPVSGMPWAKSGPP